ncbi:hypothetical protein SKAU_G00346360 [Synaphobranchus kaupii]|uniref:PI3K-RBD domain-containing protein n=1 Tax=Synaphobranchus kaupii TaxID=118154 RepID=A0A9Q1IFK9_SYNKA|nr:hypothetical protein SKAU_G00346360 [Synaphobranchus kaupii]
MAQISSGNGFGQDVSPSPGAGRPKGAVGKEEALRMESEALAKLQREKRHTLTAPFSSSSSSTTKPLSGALQGAASAGRPERDLIVFPEPEAKKRAEQDQFRDIDVEKLTNEELEKLLLDDSFGAQSKVSRPSSLLGCNLSASYPGGQAFSPSLFQGGRGPWNPSSSALQTPTPTRQQTPGFPTAPFPKPPCSFQNGLTTGMPPFLAPDSLFLSLPAQPRFMAFPPMQATSPMVFQQPPALNPEMAKLFDKIASTSEYLKNGRSASTDLESVGIKSLSPKPPASEAPSISRFEWLDLDPLNKRKAECEEAPCTPDGSVTAKPGPAGDPWDAVLLDKHEDAAGGSPPAEGRSQRPASTQLRRASIGATVTRSHSFNVPAASSPHSQNRQDKDGNGKLSAKHSFLQEMEAQNEEVVAFCEDIAALRSKFPCDDVVTNPGYVLSPVIPQRDMNSDRGSSVKVSIEIPGSQEPVTFTCDVSSPVELLIMQALCWVHDDLNQVNIGSYILKVCGQEEALQNKHSLGSHEYVQDCRKWEAEIKLQLLSQGTIRRDLTRTAEDDSAPINLEKYLYHIERPFKETVSRQILSDYLDGYHSQVSACLQNENTQYKTVDLVIQAVKNICCVLDEVETLAVTEAVKRVKRSVNLPRTKTSEGCAKSSDGSTNGCVGPVEDSLGGLTAAVHGLATLYLRSFCPVVSQQPERQPEEGRSSKEASGTTDHLQFTLFAVHGIPNAWVSRYFQRPLLETAGNAGGVSRCPILSRIQKQTLSQAPLKRSPSRLNKMG